MSIFQSSQFGYLLLAMFSVIDQLLCGDSCMYSSQGKVQNVSEMNTVVTNMWLLCVIEN